MKYDIIASGSSGNSSVFRLDNKYIFIDIGLPLCKIQPFLSTDIEDIILFITHEHTDHISGLQPFINQYSPKIYASKKTIEHLVNIGFNEDIFYAIEPNITLDFETFSVKPFNIMHDALEPFGYKFQFKDISVAYLTDIGIISDYIRTSIMGSDIIILESNYDETLLKNSKYPARLKKRITSKHGHLSNNDAYNLICKMSNTGLKEAYLAHVSENCNDYNLLNQYAASCTNDFNVKTIVLKQRSHYSIIK